MEISMMIMILGWRQERELLKAAESVYEKIKDIFYTYESLSTSRKLFCNKYEMR